VRRVTVTRSRGRLLLRIEVSKYEKWQRAAEDKKQSELEHLDSQGGSTQDRYEETESLLRQAAQNEAERWKDLTDG